MGTPLVNVNPQLFYSGVWNFLPGYASDGPTVIERGYTDEGTIRPSRLSMRINDAAAPTLNPSRPASLLYGLTGRGIPAAISCSGTVRAWMEAHTLTPDQDQAYVEGANRGKRWIDVEAYGPLYRIGQWTEDLQPPMTRTYMQYASLIGLWPGDDATMSTRVGLGRTALNFTAQDPAAPPGATACFVGQSTTSIVYSPLSSSSSGGFQVFFSSKLTGALPASPTPFFTWRANALFWSLEIDNTGTMYLKLYIGGVLIDNYAFAYAGTVDPLLWTSWRAKTYQSAGNVVVELSFYNAGAGFIAGITRSNAATIDRLSSIRITGNALVATTRYAQIGAVSGVADVIDSYAAVQSFNGWAGETTADRFTRLMTESAVPAAVAGTATTLMGPQKAGKLMDLLKECAATEDGLIYDKKDQLQTIFRTRRSRQIQGVLITLDALADVVPPFTERVDNVGVANVITIVNRDGSTGSVTKTTGPMSSAAYPSGIGPFKAGALPDVAVNLNNAAADLPAMLAWYLARGTVPGPRFPSVTIEVGLRSPGLRTAASQAEIGNRIQVTNRMADPIELQIIGIREEIDIFTWTFTFTCIPHTIFDVGSEDDMTHRLAAYASNIITAPAPATTGTSMVVGSVNPDDVWSTTSLPYPIIVAGEKMTVTACTAAALTSGTWRQTLTVTRSVNGVVKTQVAGTAVNVFAPYREAW